MRIHLETPYVLMLARRLKCPAPVAVKLSAKILLLKAVIMVTALTVQRHPDFNSFSTSQH